MSPEVIAAIAKREDSAAGPIWAENMPAVEAFAAVLTQWRIVPRAEGRSTYAGLDYAGAAAGLALSGIEANPALWADVRVMEREAMIALNNQGAGA